VFSSDAHYLADVGRVHTVLPREVEDAVSLIQFFKKALAKRPPVYRRRRARNLERGDVREKINVARIPAPDQSKRGLAQ